MWRPLPLLASLIVAGCAPSSSQRSFASTTSPGATASSSSPSSAPVTPSVPTAPVVVTTPATPPVTAPTPPAPSVTIASISYQIVGAGPVNMLSVWITGTGFDPILANDFVTINGVPATILSVNVANPAAETIGIANPGLYTSAPAFPPPPTMTVTVNGVAATLVPQVLPTIQTATE